MGIQEVAAREIAEAAAAETTLTPIERNPPIGTTEASRLQSTATTSTTSAAHVPHASGSGSTPVLATQIYAYLRALGLSEASAAGILANIQAESNFDSSAIGDLSIGGSGGLFQHHGTRWTNLKAFAAQRGTDWTDWRTQVDFAMQEDDMKRYDLQATNAHDAAKQFSLVFERPAGGARSADIRGHLANQYMLGAPDQLDAGPGSEVLNLPSGGKWFRVGGNYFVAFRFYGSDANEGPSQVVYYKATMPPPQGESIGSESSWNKKVGGWVDGGTTDTFRGTPANKSFQDLVDDLLLRLGLTGTDALKDAGVMAVIAIAMTREMSEAELSNRLRQTDWWNSRTDKQREWDDLSDAEKDLRTVDEAMKMAGLWFTYVGQDLGLGAFDRDGSGTVDPEELRRGNAKLHEWAVRVASGEVSQIQVVNVWMKEVALEDSESPWSRTIRAEEQARGEHDVDVSNMSGSIKDLYDEWGIPITDRRADKLALEVVMNRMAFEDVEESLRGQALGVYPNKPEQMSTREWAQPYMQMFMQTLEVPEVGLQDPNLQRALAGGTTLADFRTELRQDDRWLGTDNARTELNTTIAGLGRVMGF